MVIYFVLLFALFCCSCINQKRNSPLSLFLLIILICLGSFRDVVVGDDTQGSYLLNYEKITMDTSTWGYYSEMETGFSFLMAFFKTILWNNYYFFYGIIYFITALNFYIFFRKNSNQIIFTLFLYVLFLHYTLSFNIIRQYFGISLFCYVLPLLNKKTVRSLLLYIALVIFLAFAIHKSLFVLLIIPLFYKNEKLFKLLTGKSIVVILLFSLFVVYSTNFFKEYFQLLSLYLSFLGDRYSSYMGYNQMEEEQISLISCFFHTFMAIYISLVYKQKQERSLFYVCFILGVLVQNVLGAFFYLFIRVGYNLIFWEILLFTNMCYSNNMKTISYRTKYVIIVYGLIIFTNSMLKNYSGVVPYSSWLF